MTVLAGKSIGGRIKAGGAYAVGVKRGICTGCVCKKKGSCPKGYAYLEYAIF